MSDTTSTLAEAADALVATIDLRPEMAERFVADWLADWAQDGHEPFHTLQQVGEVAWYKRLGQFMSRWADYLTTEQQVQFVRNNLPKEVAAYNFQRCIAALVEKCPDEQSAEVLRNASEAADLLTSWPLQAVLGDLVAPVSDNPWTI